MGHSRWARGKEKQRYPSELLLSSFTQVPTLLEPLLPPLFSSTPLSLSLLILLLLSINPQERSEGGGSKGLLVPGILRN